jgi:DNA transformation protein and related proteins
VKERPVPIEQLKNVGPTIAHRLREVGIRTSGDLRAVGPVAAYQRICAKYPGKTIPVCYYLYSLEGALRSQHWDSLGPKIKQKLLSQVSPNKALHRTDGNVAPPKKRKTRATAARR